MIWSKLMSMVRTAPARSAPAPVRSVALTHVGHVRSVNEDRALNRPDLRLWAVADGMGGHASGDVAAQTAIDRLAACAESSREVSPENIARALAEANTAIHAGAGEGAGRSGTTIAAAWAKEDRLHLFWAGDSRIYRIRQGRVEQLTRDHSVVQQMVDAGVLSAADAPSHPKANMITRALGADRAIQIERASFTLLPGDRLLLCTDGISRTLPATVPQSVPIETLAEDIVANALARDGSDNATVVVVAFS